MEEFKNISLGVVIGVALMCGFMQIFAVPKWKVVELGCAGYNQITGKFELREDSE